MNTSENDPPNSTLETDSTAYLTSCETLWKVVKYTPPRRRKSRDGHATAAEDLGGNDSGWELVSEDLG